MKEQVHQDVLEHEEGDAESQAPPHGLQGGNIDMENKDLASCLGLALGTIFSRVADDASLPAPNQGTNYLCQLLEAACNEALEPALGDECAHFVRQMVRSFHHVYRTNAAIRLVASVQVCSNDFYPQRTTSLKEDMQRGMARTHNRQFPSLDTGDKRGREQTRETNEMQSGTDVPCGRASGAQGSLKDIVSASTRLLATEPAECKDRREDRVRRCNDVLHRASVSPGRDEGEALQEDGSLVWQGMQEGRVVPEAFTNALTGVSLGVSSGHCASREKKSDEKASLSMEPENKVDMYETKERFWRGAKPGSFSNVLSEEEDVSTSGQSSRVCSHRPVGSLPADNGAILMPSIAYELASSQELGFHGRPESRSRTGTTFSQGHFARLVEAYEERNRLSMAKFEQSSHKQRLREVHLGLAAEHNELLAMGVAEAHAKVTLRTAEASKKRAAQDLAGLLRMCADELAAGLLLMLLSLVYAVWNYARSRLLLTLQVCHPIIREQRNVWTKWYLFIPDQFQVATQAMQCVWMSTSRMLPGLILLVLVCAFIMRQNSLEMATQRPATTLFVLLSIVCGYLGKISVDSLGGSGVHWLMCWEVLCGIHFFSTSFTPLLFLLLHGREPCSLLEKKRFSIFTVTRFLFHFVITVLLPVLAGLLPFMSLDEILKLFSRTLQCGIHHVTLLATIER